MSPDDKDDDVRNDDSADVPDVRVKQLLAGDAAIADAGDAATQAELARWFALPSFTEVAEKRPAPAEDPEMLEVRARRAKACSEVDPALLARIHARTELASETIVKNTFHVTIHADPTIALFDERMVDRGHQIAEPREVEISEELRDDMKECTPQALLRDLHRPELTFEKQFEVVDVSAEQRLDIVAEVDQAMKMTLALPPLGISAFEEERRLLAQDRATRNRPWIELPMPNRTVTE